MSNLVDSYFLYVVGISDFGAYNVVPAGDSLQVKLSGTRRNVSANKRNDLVTENVE